MTVSGDPKVVLTPAALVLLRRVAREQAGRLALVIGNGCCDATAPYLFADYLPGPNERRIGEVEGVPVYLDVAVELSFAGAEVVVDARDDPQPDSFSCEAELGRRFTLNRMPSAAQTAS